MIPPHTGAPTSRSDAAAGTAVAEALRHVAAFGLPHHLAAGAAEARAADPPATGDRAVDQPAMGDRTASRHAAGDRSPSQPATSAGTGAPPGVPPSIATTPLTDDRWATFRREVERLRLTGFLQAAIDAGAVAVTEVQRHEVADAHLRWSATALQLERRLLEVLDHLERAGIEVVVLKGSAHAHLLYPDPSWRLFGDNDLLVRGEAFGDALTVLTGLGYQRPVPEPRPGFDARFGKGASLVRPGHDELDLHRTLVFGSFGLVIDPDVLFDDTATFELGGRSVRALGADTRLLHACYHAALGDPDPRLGSVRDIAQQLALATHEDERVLELARRWRALPVLARAFGLCRSHLGVEVSGPLAEAATAHRSTVQERRAVASHVGLDRSHTAKVVASLPYLDRVSDKVAFVRAFATPSPEFLRARGARRRPDWLARGARALRRRRR